MYFIYTLYLLNQNYPLSIDLISGNRCMIKHRSILLGVKYLYIQKK